jgi:hypothetical protein
MNSIATISSRTKSIPLQFLPVPGLILLLLPSLVIGQDRELISKARSGDTQAQYDLGEHNFNSREYSRAARMRAQAARDGNASAQNKLAEMKSIDERKRKYEEIKWIEDSYIKNKIFDNRYIDNCDRYMHEAELREETTRCLIRAKKIHDEKIRKLEEEKWKLEGERGRLDEENGRLEEQLRKYEEIKRIEDSYVKNKIFDMRYRDNCERYYSEAKMDGEKTRCLERSLSIMKNMQR